MARDDIFKGMFGALKANSTLLGLLGPVVPTNCRLYAGWPQTQPALTGLGDPDEGWLIYYEDPSEGDKATIYDDLMINFEVYVNRGTLADLVIDQLDAEWNWQIPQQKDLTYAEWFITNARRLKTVHGYSEPGEGTQGVRLTKKTVTYWLQAVRATPA